MILLFSNADSRDLLNELVNQATALDKRDLVVFHFSEANQSSFTNTQIDYLREKYQKNHQHFTLVLIGKDGGVKLSSDSFVELKELFELIDGMPMRRIEMESSAAQN